MIQKTMDSYFNLCTQFYDTIRPNPPDDAYDFYRNYVIEANGLVLEPMCGTGRFLIPLLQEGFTVHGFDASEHMLGSLYHKALVLNLEPTVWPSYIENLKRSERYKLIFIPSGSFGHVIDLNDVTNVLKIMFEHLADDGIFLFEAETSQSIPSELDVWRTMDCQRADGKIIRIHRLTTLKESVCYSIDKYELLDSNQVIQTECEIFNVRLYDDPNLLISMLNNAGFKEVKTLKAFDKKIPSGYSDVSIVYECKK